jgi:hypothetical protein
VAFPFPRQVLIGRGAISIRPRVSTSGRILQLPQSRDPRADVCRPEDASELVYDNTCTYVQLEAVEPVEAAEGLDESCVTTGDQSKCRR